MEKVVDAPPCFTVYKKHSNVENEETNFMMFLPACTCNCFALIHTASRFCKSHAFEKCLPRRNSHFCGPRHRTAVDEGGEDSSLFHFLCVYVCKYIMGHPVCDQVVPTTLCPCLVQGRPPSRPHTSPPVNNNIKAIRGVMHACENPYVKRCTRDARA